MTIRHAMSKSKMLYSLSQLLGLPGADNLLTCWFLFSNSLTTILQLTSPHKSLLLESGKSFKNSSPLALKQRLAIVMKRVGYRSTASTGVRKAVRAVELLISWFGRTKAPTATGPWSLSFPSATMILKKCVGTATEGGDPMTSYVTRHFPSGYCRGKYNGPLKIRTEAYFWVNRRQKSSKWAQSTKRQFQIIFSEITVSVETIANLN